MSFVFVQLDNYCFGEQIAHRLSFFVCQNNEIKFWIFYFLSFYFMVNCKYCWWEIPDDVVKCKHCWEYQDMKYKWKWVLVKPSLFQKVFCTHCHNTWSPKTVTKGSILLEIFLWLFIIPWMIYSWYRHKSRYCVCSKCWSDQINTI